MPDKGVGTYKDKEGNEYWNKKHYDWRMRVKKLVTDERGNLSGEKKEAAKKEAEKGNNL